MAYTVVGVRFKAVGKTYYFDTNNLEIEQFDHVIVETARGIEYGEVALSPRIIEEESYEFPTPLKPVIRLATMKDTQDFHDLKQKETEARDNFIAKVKKHNLDMKLIDVEYTFDKKKAIFYFTAEGRVDFRDLVKDLASIFKVRIELRQIGVRDEAKKFKTLGVCGRTTCCAQWLGDFTPVSIKMAKEQSLSLNSTKISGICGRLLCCLNYEQQFYETVSKKMPKVGYLVDTPEGEGEVYRQCILQESVIVKIKTANDETEMRQFNIDDIKILGKARHTDKNVDRNPAKDGKPPAKETSPQNKATDVFDSKTESTPERNNHHRNKKNKDHKENQRNKNSRRDYKK